MSPEGSLSSNAEVGPAEGAGPGGAHHSNGPPMIGVQNGLRGPTKLEESAAGAVL